METTQMETKQVEFKQTGWVATSCGMCYVGCGIQVHVENPLAQEILGGKFVPGDTIHIGFKKDKIVFGKATAMV